MKLTQTIRQAFVSAVMADVPEVDYRAQAQTVLIDEARRQLPPKVRALYDDKSTQHFVRTDNHYILHQYVYIPCGRGDRFVVAEAAQQRLDELTKLFDEQIERRKELQQKLHACALACSTRKALVEMLPEFEKYLPADEAAANRALPVVANVVAAFEQAGWPKGKAPAANEPAAKPKRAAGGRRG